MILEGLTYGENKSEEKIPIPLVEFVGICIQQLSVVSSLINGTEGKEWLIESENEANKIIKNG